MTLASYSLLRMHSRLLLLITLLFSTGAVADHKIYYSSYISGKANIYINGHTKALSPGQTSKEGVKLLSFNKKENMIAQQLAETLKKSDTIAPHSYTITAHPSLIQQWECLLHVRAQIRRAYPG